MKVQKTHNFNNWLSGTYLSNDNSDTGYIIIPKNASSYMRDLVEETFGWTTEFNYNDNPKQKYIVVLRDPYERWITGVAEYFHLNHRNLSIDNDVLLHFMCQRVIFDVHTEEQRNFIQGINLKNITFFKLNENLSSNLRFYVTEKKFHNQLDLELNFNYFKKNTTIDSDEKVQLVNIIKRFLKNNPKYIHRIKDRYKLDYALIKKVKFYGTN